MADSNAKRRWDSENTTKVTVKLNRKTDAKIIARLESVDNKAAYIKSLILRDTEGDGLIQLLDEEK